MLAKKERKEERNTSGTIDIVESYDTEDLHEINPGKELTVLQAETAFQYFHLARNDTYSNDDEIPFIRSTYRPILAYSHAYFRPFSDFGTLSFA